MKNPEKRRLVVSVSVIIHATEDITRMQDAMRDILHIDADALVATKTKGHFENPITILDANLKGSDAKMLISGLGDMLSDSQKSMLAEQIEERTVDSRLHLRLDKQVLVRDRRPEIVGLDDMLADGRGRDIIKIKIHTPIYKKSDTRRAFEEVFGMDCRRADE